ncbi:BnaC03g15530D [Brassica napus]|uniref:Uncharacterized protein n=2 Tax=Brassica TaxID=3705 RepID=A0A3P6AF78_BRAOL|nr:unnamed protein product [Brassica napus]CDY32585.1 BnaC03g15530D [Brassica napus]VDC88225.1 unnamed protein product [Brassica oleracea]
MDGGGITIRYKGVTVHTPKTWHDLYVFLCGVRLSIKIEKNLSNARDLFNASIYTNQLTSQSGLSPRDSTCCLCFPDQKRKPKLYLMHAASKELKIRATSSVSELQRSTPSSDVNMTAEFELELQELFNDVKSMVKIGVIWLRLKPLPALLDMINKIVDKLRDNKDEIDMSILVATRWIVPADAAASEECVGGEEHMGRIV